MTVLQTLKRHGVLVECIPLDTISSHVMKMFIFWWDTIFVLQFTETCHYHDHQVTGMQQRVQTEPRKWKACKQREHNSGKWPNGKKLLLMTNIHLFYKLSKIPFILLGFDKAILWGAFSEEGLLANRYKFWMLASLMSQPRDWCDITPCGQALFYSTKIPSVKWSTDSECAS